MNLTDCAKFPTELINPAEIKQNHKNNFTCDTKQCT